MKKIYENGVIVGERYGKSVLYHIKNFKCHFDGEDCFRVGWCVRKSKKYAPDGHRVKIMDVCSRYPNSQTRL